MKRKFRYIIGQFLNSITGFTTFLESESERRAYEVLRNSGYRLKKQYRIHPYRLDFYLPECRVNVEIDGNDHFRRRDKDQYRDKAMLRIGIRTLRIPAEQLYRKNYQNFILKKLKDFTANPIPRL